MFCHQSLIVTSIAFLVSSASATAPPVPVGYIQNCVQCLDNNYVWTVGECHESCDVADAACFDHQYFPGQSSSQICQQQQPSQPQPQSGTFQNCAACVGNGFAWTIGECHATCDVADASCFAQKYFPKESPHRICSYNQGDTSMDAESHDFRNCRPCVAHGFAWAAGECLDNCDEIADAACYSQEYFKGQSCNQICRQAENDAQRDKLRQCRRAGQSCGSCLAAGCNWSGESCVPSCNDLADAACYGFENFPRGTTGADICAVAHKQASDASLCNAHATCGSCTRAVKSDGSSCAWYPGDDQGPGYCGTGGCDVNGICGETVCAEPESLAKTGLRGNHAR